MELNDSYLPPNNEDASNGAEPPEYTPPPEFVDYWDWSRIQDHRNGVRTGRLAPWLREAARTQNPIDILQRAVIARFRPVTANALAESQALADLAVTGRAAFTAFIASPPDDVQLLSLVQPSLPTTDRTLIQSTVRTVLDRAYSVAWALRGSPSQRRALRPTLGWIALSSEDDSPHARTNVPASEDLMGELTMRVGRSDPQVILRATLMLPTIPLTEPLPDIASRSVPTSTVFENVLNDRATAGYDELFLFVHGLGSVAEESGKFKQRLIEIGAAQGKRYAILSVDMPGMGYSSRLDIDDLVRRRVRGHHGFQLPNGVGSNFPLLGFYRDTLTEICNNTAGGIQYVMGGSLGGNLTLWMAAEPMFTDIAPGRTDSPSIINFLCWSPASIWESYERSRDTPFEGNGTHLDIGKNGAKRRPQGRMQEREEDRSRWNFFAKMQLGEELLGLATLGAWGYPPTESGLLLQAELYSEDYRRTFWTAAYEQVTFSHQEPLTPSRQWPFSTIRKPLFLAAGAEDVGALGVMDIYNPTVDVSNRNPAVPGRRYLMQETGHSISDIRPCHLAEQIVDFVFRRQTIVALQAYNGLYVRAKGGGGGVIEAIAPEIDEYAMFILVDLTPDQDATFAQGESSQLSLRAPRQVALQAHSGQYLGASGGGGGTLDAARSEPRGHETFTLVDVGGGRFSLSTQNNVIGVSGVDSTLDAARTEVGRNETFTLIQVRRPMPYVAFQSYSGHYIGAAGGGGSSVDASRTAIGTHETFRIVQVNSDTFVLRTYSGHYVGAAGGGGGALDAARTEPKEYERFKLIDVGCGKVALQSNSGHYVGAAGGGGSSIDAGRTAIGDNETFTLVVAQKLSKQLITLLAYSGRYVGVSGGGGGSVDAGRTAIGANEKFYLIRLGDGKVALQTFNERYYIGVAGRGSSVAADRTAIGSNETFNLIRLGDGKVALQTLSDRYYIGVSGGVGNPVNAGRTAIGTNETFILEQI